LRHSGPPLLLVNPWIYDFAAYDYFARPLGLLYLAGRLEASGFDVRFLDCLDGVHVQEGPFGTGRYPKEILPAPPPLQGLPRRYGRYGISLSEFQARLSRVPEPAAVLVTSLMTYWYPGVMEAIRQVRRRFPRPPVILGGIYATLCPEHARRHSGADLVVSGPGEEFLRRGLGDVLSGMLEVPAGDWEIPDPSPLDSLPYPALRLASNLSFIPILTSRGCPLDCAYCASRLLQPTFRRRSPLAVAGELCHWQDFLGLREVAFYDDALLVAAEDRLLPLLAELARRGRSFRFHTPNGLHARLVTPEVARELKRAGFATLRLGVETAAPGEARLDRKLAPGELEVALSYLKDAGFRPEQIGVYLMLGLPHQEEGEIAASIRRVKDLGAAPILAQYSPIPGTALWEAAVACSPYDLENEPLFHNNSLFPCLPRFSWDTYTRLKCLAAA
jgi:radical SAM superfamily enzyme YgiQ (UPF0313 family)